MATLKGFRVEHSKYAEAQEKLKTAIECAGDQGICIPLLGPTRVGKTNILKSLRLEYSGEGARFEDFFSVAGFAIDAIRPKPNDAELYSAILRAAGKQVGVRDRLSTLQNRALNVFARQGIKVIALDECSHCAEPGANFNRRSAADHFKHIIDSSKCVLILSGLPKFQSLIAENEQFAARCMSTVEFHPYRWHDPEERDDFVGVAVSVFEFIQDQGVAVEFDFLDMSRRLYAASGGRVGMIVNLMETALRAAESKTRFTFADVERGFLMRMQAGPHSGDVFAHESPTDEELARTYMKVLSEAGLPFPKPANSDELEAIMEHRRGRNAA